ncbi:MAG: hypothetical protein KDF65_12580, partial [Anaerolineae bacterium]|nr:hypothetical protein [Anaerolineae bacterium]
HDVTAMLEAAQAESAEAAAALDIEAQQFQVAATQLAMNSAGFHGMDEYYNQDDGQIMAGDAPLVLSVARLVNETEWPAELQPMAEEFGDLLAEYHQALADNDLAAVKAVVAEAHELQHDFSAEIGNWLGTADGHDHGEMEHDAMEEGESDHNHGG